MNRCTKEMQLGKSSKTYQCMNPSKHEIDGKFYCGVHAPNKIGDTKEQAIANYGDLMAGNKSAAIAKAKGDAA